MVNAILDEELAAHDEMLVNSYRILDNRDGALAAGTASSGVSIIEDQPTPIFVQINDMTKHADAVITVRGRSMEPKYHPGDKVAAGSLVSLTGSIVSCYSMPQIWTRFL